MIETEIVEDGSNCSPTIHFLSNFRCPGVFNQNLVGFKYVGISSNQPNEIIQSDCIKQAESLSQALKLKGPWGIDFIVDKDNNSFVIDINVGRMCGSHYSRIFMSMYAPNKAFYSKKLVDNSINIHSLQRKLIEKEINFDFLNQKGIMFLRNNEITELTAIFTGNNDQEVKLLRQIFLSEI